MRQLALESNTYLPYGPATSGRLYFPRPQAVWIVLSALAALALFMTIAGPGLTHHYAELTPFHSQVSSFGPASVSPPKSTATPRAVSNVIDAE